MTTVAIMAQGAMGAAIGRRLTDGGAKVLTCLAGRGAASRARAEEAGMIDVDLPAFGDADIFLSIVPPDAALATAKAVLPHLATRGRSLVYVDCNAVSPATVREVAALVETSGVPFVDASIIGPPPTPGSTATVFYASGDASSSFQLLTSHGLDIRTLEGGLGAASALKMCYAGIAKGLTGIAAAMILAATREGAEAALLAELTRSQPEILGLLRPRIPDMLPKAYRWAGEMEEIAEFVGADGGEDIYRGLAQLYRSVALDLTQSRENADALQTFVTAPSASAPTG